jgi:hypothetical protein
MGALYYPTDDASPNAPPNSGTLFKLALSENASLTVTLNEVRGGVVLTDPEVAATVDLSQATNVGGGGEDVFPASHPDYAVGRGRQAAVGPILGSATAMPMATRRATQTGYHYVGPRLNVLPPDGFGTAAWPGITSIQNGSARISHTRGRRRRTGWYRVVRPEPPHDELAGQRPCTATAEL